MGTAAADAPDSAIAGCGGTKISVDSREYFYTSVTSCAKMSHCCMSRRRPRPSPCARRGEAAICFCGPTRRGHRKRARAAANSPPGPTGGGDRVGSCFSKNLRNPLFRQLPGGGGAAANPSGEAGAVPREIFAPGLHPLCSLHPPPRPAWEQPGPAAAAPRYNRNLETGIRGSNTGRVTQKAPQRCRN